MPEVASFHLPQTFQALLGLSIHKGQHAVLLLLAHLPTGVSFHILGFYPQTRSISDHLANTFGILIPKYVMYFGIKTERCKLIIGYNS